MVLLVTDVFVLLTQVLLWVVVGLFTWYVLLRALPRPLLGGLVLLLLLGVAALTFYQGAPEQGLLGDIWRIIAIPFSPLGLILILLLIAFSEVFRGKGLSSRGINLIRVGVPLLLILSLPAVSYFLAQRTEAEALQITRPAPIEALGGGRRVIVVLAQDTTRLQLRPLTQPVPPPTRPANQGSRAPLIQPPEPLNADAFNILISQPIQLTEKGNRLTYAGQLYQEERARGTSPLLIVSAGSVPGREEKAGDTRDSTSETRAARTFLQDRFGIPAGDVIEDNQSESAHASAVNVRELLQRQNINFGNQLFVVTSAIEMSRTALTFNREFASESRDSPIIPRPTDFYTLPQREAIRQRATGRDLVERGFRTGDLLPSADAFSLSSRVINEYITSIYYFLRGWIRPVRTL